MIDKMFTALDINPYTWKNLGALTDAILPVEKTVFILHEGGSVLNVFHPDKGLCSLSVDLTDYGGSAETLLAADHGIDCVLFLEKDTVPGFMKAINNMDVRNMDAVTYMSLMYRTFYEQEGVRAFRRKPLCWDFYERLGSYLRNHYPPDCTVALSVFDGDTLFFDVIFIVRSYSIHGITSFDSLFHETTLTKKDEACMRTAFAERHSSGYFYSFSKSDFYELIENFKTGGLAS